MKHIFLFAMLVFALQACNSGPANFEGGVSEKALSLSPPSKMMEMAVTTPKKENEQLQKRNPQENQKLIREGTLGFETKDLKSSRKFISDLSDAYGSYIQQESNKHSDYEWVTELTLRIPSENYDELIEKIETHAFKLTEKNIRVIDVTDEFIDVQARLKAKYELEHRYLDLLKRAKNVEEVLSVEAQMTGVRYEIESMEGRMRSLRDRIAYSTLKLSFFQPIAAPKVESPTYVSKLISALESGWEILLSIFLGLVFLWPFIIFFTIGGFLALRWKRKHREETPQTT